MWCLPPGNCPACPYGLTFRNCLWMWANICMKTIVSFHTKDENNISSELLSIPFSIFCTRACLKKAFCKMCVTICGIFCPDEGAVAGYGNWIRVKYPAKWGVQIAGMIFQTHSSSADEDSSHSFPILVNGFIVSSSAFTSLKLIILFPLFLYCVLLWC